jgi:hypothetical protein
LLRIFWFCGVLSAVTAALRRSPMPFADSFRRSLLSAIFCRSSSVSRGVPAGMLSDVNCSITFAAFAGDTLGKVCGTGQ